MQNNNNYIDDKLRQLEADASPNISKMEEHLAGFRSMAVPTTPRSSSNWILWTAAAILVAVTVFFFFHEKGQINENAIVNGTTNAKTDTVKTKLVYMTKSIDSSVSRSATQEKSIYSKGIQTKDSSKLRIINSTEVPKEVKLRLDTVKQGLIDNRTAQLEEFYFQMEKPTQVFIINNNRDTLIKGREGSAFFIAANSFTSKNEVRIKLKEFYSYSDIVANKLTTTSNQQLLESGGMIHITADDSKNEVVLKPGKSIRWFVPNDAEQMKNMQLFVLNNYLQTNKIVSGINNERSPVSTSTSGSMNWIAQGQTFNSSSITQYYVINQEYPPTYKDTVPKRVPVYVSGKDTSYAYQKKKANGLLYLDTTLIIRTDVARTQADSITRSRFDEVKQQFGVDLYTMGWINCDRFVNDPRPKLSFIVELNDDANAYNTMLVFDELKSVMPGNIYGRKVIFSKVPAGAKAKVISVGIQNGKPVSSMTSVTISETVLTNLKFELTTAENFRNDLNVLDK